MTTGQDSKIPNKHLSVSNDTGAWFQNHTNNSASILCDICWKQWDMRTKKKNRLPSRKENSGAITGGEGGCLWGCTTEQEKSL